MLSVRLQEKRLVVEVVKYFISPAIEKLKKEQEKCRNRPYSHSFILFDPCSIVKSIMKNSGVEKLDEEVFSRETYLKFKGFLKKGELKRWEENLGRLRNVRETARELISDIKEEVKGFLVSKYWMEEREAMGDADKFLENYEYVKGGMKCTGRWYLRDGVLVGCCQEERIKRKLDELEKKAEEGAGIADKLIRILESVKERLEKDYSLTPVEITPPELPLEGGIF